MFKAIKKFIKFILILLGLCVVCWCIIHRRVIIAKLTGGEIPPMPEWHKDCFKKFLGCGDCCEE